MRIILSSSATVYFYRFYSRVYDIFMSTEWFVFFYQPKLIKMVPNSSVCGKIDWIIRTQFLVCDSQSEVVDFDCRSVNKKIHWLVYEDGSIIFPLCYRERWISRVFVTSVALFLIQYYLESYHRFLKIIRICV